MIKTESQGCREEGRVGARKGQHAWGEDRMHEGECRHAPQAARGAEAGR